MTGFTPPVRWPRQKELNCLAPRLLEPRARGGRASQAKSTTRATAPTGTGIGPKATRPSPQHQTLRRNTDHLIGGAALAAMAWQGRGKTAAPVRFSSALCSAPRWDVTRQQLWASAMLRAIGWPLSEECGPVQRHRIAKVGANDIPACERVTAHSWPR